MDLGEMLRLLDRYPLAVEVKGSSVQVQATQWIITSNLHPSEWYLKASLEHKAALTRRFTKVEYVDNTNEVGSPAAPIVL